MGRTFDTEAEKFDEEGAASLMASKKTWGKLNPLFLDTRMFNQSSQDYAPELSKPAGLEQYEKEMDGSSGGGSPFKQSQNEHNQSFGSIRAGHTLSNDV